MLIDDLMPRYDVVETHRTRVRAPRERTWDALFTADFAKGGMIRVLMGMRALPGALFAGPVGWRSLVARATAPITVTTLEANGFTRVAESAPAEIVFGIEGRFWTLVPDRCTPPATAFLYTEPAPGMARALWNFAFRADGADHTIVTTETRVLCADAAVRRRFLPYWTVVQPGSGLIRRSMLARLRETAESRQ